MRYCSNDTVQSVAATNKIKEVNVTFHVHNENVITMNAPFSEFAKIKNIINQFEEGGKFIEVTNKNNKDVLNLTYIRNSVILNNKLNALYRCEIDAFIFLLCSIIFVVFVCFCVDTYNYNNLGKT